MTDLTDNNDVFEGDETAEEINGLKGSDFIEGLGGNDTINGDGGFDTLLGGEGDDSLNGGDGTDSLLGGDGEDTLLGGNSSDTLNGGAGADLLDGGGSADFVDYSDSDEGVVVNLLNDGTGTASGGHAEGDQFINIQNIIGSAHDDVISSFGNKVVLDGGAGNDTIIGGTNFDRLIGGTGDDVINGNGAGGDGDVAQYSGSVDDYVVGLSSDGKVRIVDLRTGVENEGVDTLTGIARLRFSDGDVLTNDLVDDTLLFGTNSSDTIVARNTSVNIAGFDGDDDITGNALDNTILGGAGNDTIDGGDGTDTVVFEGNQADYTFSFGPDGTILVTDLDGETDTLVNVEQVFFGDSSLPGDIETFFSSTPSEGDDLITGNAEDEVIDALAGDDFVSGLGGNDTLIGGIGADTLDGGANDDTADYSGSTQGVTINLNDGTASGGDADGDVLVSIENLIGTVRADVLTGTDTGEEFENFFGDVSIDGNILDGGRGDDVLSGLGGNDWLIGGRGDDTLLGGDDDDVLDGGAQDDVIDGGEGNDTAVYVDFGGTVSVDLRIETAQDTGAGGFDTITNVENLVGGDTRNNFIGTGGGEGGDNLLDGGGGNDRLQGLGGDDTLIGGDGNDVLRSGSGDDVLNGGAGRDKMVGGSGADTFVFSAASDSAVGGQRDRIDDFEQGVDVIDLSAIGEFDLIGTAEFSGVAGELRQFDAPNRTIIEADIDGDGIADFQIELFTAGLILTEADFFSVPL